MKLLPNDPTPEMIAAAQMSILADDFDVTTYYRAMYDAAPEVKWEPEAEIIQAITDPENQPSQFGTVTLDYMKNLICSTAEPFGYFCDWGDFQGMQRIAMYYGEPGSATYDDWNEIPKAHKNLPLYTHPQPDAAELVEALKKLSCLGNGDIPGNSEGNMIARAALAKWEGK